MVLRIKCMLSYKNRRTCMNSMKVNSQTTEATMADGQLSPVNFSAG